MTTIRDVIAKCWDDKGELGLQNADVILRALLSAPESVRLELAGKLNPWRPIETAPKDGTFVAATWKGNHVVQRLHLNRDGDWTDGNEAYMKPCLWCHLPAPPPEDK